MKKLVLAEIVLVMVLAAPSRILFGQENPGNVVIEYEPEQITEIIPVENLQYELIEKFCKSMLSKTGTMGKMPEKGAVVVHDYRANVAKVKAFISKADWKAQNIRIDIDFINTGASSGGGIDAEIGYKDDPSVNKLIIDDGKVKVPDKYKFGARRETGRTSRNNSQFIVTKSGSPARLFVGKTILDPSWLREYRLVPTVIVTGSSGGSVFVPGSVPEFVWRDVGAKLYVLPRLLASGRIDVEVYPVVTYIDGEGEEQAARIEELSTHVTVEPGQRIPLGGVIDDNKSVYKNLFGPDFSNRDSSVSVLDMYLTASVLKRGDRSSNIPRRGKLKDDLHDIPRRKENPHDWR